MPTDCSRRRCLALAAGACAGTAGCISVRDVVQRDEPTTSSFLDQEVADQPKHYGSGTYGESIKHRLNVSLDVGEWGKIAIETAGWPQVFVASRADTGELSLLILKREEYERHFRTREDYYWYGHTHDAESSSSMARNKFIADEADMYYCIIDNTGTTPVAEGVPTQPVVGRVEIRIEW